MTEQTTTPPHACTVSHGLIFRGSVVMAALFGSSGVAVDALASHLPDSAFAIAQGRDHLHTAATMALWHGIALLALCLNAVRLRSLQARAVCVGMTVGTLLFSLPVALHALGILPHAYAAPIGGSLLILSWLGLITTLPKCCH